VELGNALIFPPESRIRIVLASNLEVWRSGLSRFAAIVYRYEFGERAEMA